MKRTNLAALILTAALGLGLGPASFAAVIEINVVMDLSDDSIYDVSDASNLTQLTTVIESPLATPYAAGDTLSVVVTFVGNQRLQLTASPLGISYPLGQEAIGLYIEDSSLPYEVSGSSDYSASLIDPQGSFFTDSVFRSNSFVNARGAILRAGTDWTDSAFSVAGLSFDIQLFELSQPILPDSITLDLREVTVRVVPIPAAIWLMGSGLMMFSVLKRRT